MTTPKLLVAAFVAVVVIGCEVTPPPVMKFQRYKLQDGTIVECASEYSLGVNLSNCKDGKEYLGQTNVTRLP